MVVGFQGEPAAFSDDAARLLVPGAETRGYPSFEELLEAANTQAVDLALLPVENSIYGAIARSYDLLGSYSDLTIVDEIVYRVVQTLIGTPDASIETIKEVRSHPVALEQCRKLFSAHPDWKRTIVEDTAGAAAAIVASGDRTIAAIGSQAAALRYGAKILKEVVQDDAENFTRFYLVQRSGKARRNLRRACVVLGLPDGPGTLRDALTSFAEKKINLRSLVSRPSHDGPFQYRFYCEIDNVEIRTLAQALAEIKGESKVLGIY